MPTSRDLGSCLPVLAASPLFARVGEDELPEALGLLDARSRAFGKGELVQRLGEPFRRMGIVVLGSVEGSFDTERFDQVDMRRFGPGDMYGAAFACAGTDASPIQLEAHVETEVVLLDVRPLMDPARLGARPVLEETLLRNLLAMVARQSTFLARKVRILGQRSLRDRIVVFLRGLPQGEGGWRELPFSQTAMAQFIGANRSAVSRELGRMADEGLVRLDGRRVLLLG